MRLVKCDQCEKSEPMPRDYYTSYPVGFRKVEIDKLYYEYCSKNCEIKGLLSLIGDNRE